MSYKGSDLIGAFFIPAVFISLLGLQSSLIQDAIEFSINQISQPLI